MVIPRNVHLPRGIRNKNPLNIRDNANNNWLGKTGVDNEKFVVFESPELGYRAATKILMSYRRRGLTTLEEIISTWSPQKGVDAFGNTYENPTNSYVLSVADKTGILPSEEVDSSDYVLLLKAMTFHENGINPYTDSVIAKGVDLAYG